MEPRNLEKAAQRGEPSYIWRTGQERRLGMILEAAGSRSTGRVLVAGCGVGTYLGKLDQHASQAVGVDIEFERTEDSHRKAERVINGSVCQLPFAVGVFDLVLSHEVLEHVGDDHLSIIEMVRVLKPGGRLVLFCPNRGYPFETHGVYWRGTYRFGNIPLVNYLPRRWRDRLAPHVQVYSRGDLERLFNGLPVQFVHRKTIFGAYDNIITRFPAAGKLLRGFLQMLEKDSL